MLKSLVLFFFCVFLSFGEEDSTIVTDIEPPTGNKQFFTGMGITIGGIVLNVIGIYALTNVGEDELRDSPKDIYGERYDSTIVISKNFKTGFGWTCFIGGVCLDAVGIPLLVKGHKLKEKRNEWEERTKISLHINPFFESYSLRSTISF
jgi:hypothetical protein